MIRDGHGTTLRFVERNGRFILQQCVGWTERDDYGRYVASGFDWRDVPLWDEVKQEYKT